MTQSTRILLIDDDVELLQMMSIILEKAGFQVDKADDGLVGISMAEKKVPDLIILDVMMPGMDGITLCRVIRERGELKRTPILILSARNDSDSVMRGMDAGANDYLPKPILHHDLVTKVKTMLP